MKRQTAGLTLHMGWEKEVYKSFGTRDALNKAVKIVESYAKGDAPRRGASGRTSWNSIRNNIHSVVAMDRDGWYGGVVTEINDRVRHAMLVETGFDHVSGRRVPGRRWLKGALFKAGQRAGDSR